jgi:hypothetical protein
VAGKFEVAVNKVRFKVPLADDEIDLESGFLMLPQAIPQLETPGGPGPVRVTSGGGADLPSGGGVGVGTITPGGTQTPSGTTIDPAKPTLETMVELSFSADRNGLFTAWNAIANLADMAGRIALIIRAESAQGFDKTKLQNGVMEPLREADLID